MTSALHVRKSLEFRRKSSAVGGTFPEILVMTRWKSHAFDSQKVRRNNIGLKIVRRPRKTVPDFISVKTSPFPLILFFGKAIFEAIRNTSAVCWECCHVYQPTQKHKMKLWPRRCTFGNLWNFVENLRLSAGRFRKSWSWQGENLMHLTRRKFAGITLGWRS